MKFSSATRLRLVSIVTATILTGAIGTFISFQSFQNSISVIDYEIDSTIDDAIAAPNQELSAALFHIDDFSLDLSLFLVSRDGSVTTVNESTVQIFEEITLSKAEAAQSKTISGGGVYEIRLRSFEISGGDYLVVAGSSSEATKTLRSNLISVLLITLLASFIAFFALTLYIRKLKRNDDEEALRRMQSFLGDASHELRTPLTVIKGYVEMLSKGQLTSAEDQNRAFSRVTNEIGRMETLIRDLLLLAELGESAHRENEIIDLSSLLHLHAQDFATLNPERKLTLSIQENVEVRAAGEYLLRFIQNALNNISRHTDSTAPVTLTLLAKGKFAELTIADGGAGLPDSAYDEQIQSLTRFDKSRSRESGGSGLGMSIMAAVIAKLEGHLKLRKSDLGGLAVIAEIPLYRG